MVNKNLRDWDLNLCHVELCSRSVEQMNLCPESVEQMKLYKLTLFVFTLYRKADESRLREVCESFLGPPIGMGAASSNQNIEWDPCVLVRLYFLIVFVFDIGITNVLHYRTLEYGIEVFIRVIRSISG